MNPISGDQRLSMSNFNTPELFFIEFVRVSIVDRINFAYKNRENTIEKILFFFLYSTFVRFYCSQPTGERYRLG